MSTAAKLPAGQRADGRESRALRRAADLGVKGLQGGLDAVTDQTPTIRP